MGLYPRAWASARKDNSIPRSSFAQNLAETHPIPGRSIVAGAISKEPESYLSTIIESFPYFDEWTRTVATSVYPESHLPADRYALEGHTASFSIPFASLSPGQDATVFTPLELVAVGYHRTPPTSVPPSAESVPLARIPTYLAYQLANGVSPALNYEDELLRKDEKKKPTRQKKVLTTKRAPKSIAPPKTVFPRRSDPFATVAIGRDKIALGKPSLNRRNRSIVESPSNDGTSVLKRRSSASASAAHRRGSFIPRSVLPPISSKSQSEVISLIDDDDNGPITLAPAQPSGPEKINLSPSQPNQTKSPSQGKNAMPPLRSRKITLQSQVPPPPQLQVKQVSQQGTPLIPSVDIDMCPVTPGDMDPAFPMDEPPLATPAAVFNTLMGNTLDESTPPLAASGHNAETQDLIVADNQVMEAEEGVAVEPGEEIVPLEKAHPARTTNQTKVQDRNHVQNQGAQVQTMLSKEDILAAKRADPNWELEWKRTPNMERIYSGISSLRKKQELKQIETLKSVEADTFMIGMPDSAFARQQKRKEVAEKKKQQAIAAKERHKMAAARQLEKKKKIAKRKRKAAARARGEVYHSESEMENADPPEPEDQDPYYDPNAADEPERAEPEVMEATNDIISPAGGQTRRLSINMHRQHDQFAKRQRIDEHGHFPLRAQLGGDHGQKNMHQSPRSRGLPWPDHAYNGESQRRNDYPARDGPSPPRAGPLPGQQSSYRGNNGHQSYPNGQSASQSLYPPPNVPFQADIDRYPPQNLNYPPPPSNYGTPPGNHHSPNQMSRGRGYEPGGRFPPGHPQGPPQRSPYPNHPPGYGSSHNFPPGPPPPEMRRRYPPQEYESRRRELYNEIQDRMEDLQVGDRNAIENFIDNQRDMFLPGETTRSFRLQLRNRTLTKLRINKEDGTWQIVNSKV